MDTWSQWIRACEIFKKYGEEAQYSFHHDKAFFGGPDWEDLSDGDRAELEGLGFFEDEGSASLFS